MKRLLSLVASSVLLASLLVTTVSANPSKGKKLYLKAIKQDCDMNGAKMATQHTQDEWEALKESDKLENELKKICPNLKDVEDEYLPDLFDFFYEYGSDSGNVPACS
jgi:hypothetical protein